jgi:serine/threonine protein kinase
LQGSIVALVQRPVPHRAFIWPIDIVASDQVAGFGYVMALKERRFISFAQMLNHDPPQFRTIIAIGREVVDAFAALHASGLCYRDINFGNLWVDPARAEVAILDNDNVGLDSGDVFVKGSHQFMAPEVVRDEQLPSTVTDLYSLAVFLFYLFVHGHPLEGIRTNASYSWADSQHETETELLLRNFGRDPLFVFDPDDPSNRPPPGSPVTTWWWIYPGFFRHLFVKSFTTGLRDASLTGRVTEGVWRRALVRLSDHVSECQCRASVFYDPHDVAKACWNCGNVPLVPPLLQLPGRTVVLCEGATITSRDPRRDPRRDSGREDRSREDRGREQTLAAVVRQPNKAGYRFLLRNLTTEVWTVAPEGEEIKTVAPSQLLGARPMAIDFGPVKGTIVVAAQGSTGHW